MNNRVSLRKRVMFAAKILLEGGGSIDCMLRDRSETGVRLKVVTVLGVPSRFTLLIEATGEKRQVEIAWKKATEIGAHFV